MASLRDYFDTDFKYVLCAHRGRKIRSKEGEVVIEVVERLHLDFDANTKYISYFIPKTRNSFDICAALIQQNPRLALSLTDEFSVAGGSIGQDRTISSAELKFSGRIFLYSESGLSTEEVESLNNKANELSMVMIFRGPKYAEEKAILEKPLAFISYDSHDKDEVARPLAIELSRMLCPVWFDEFSLKVGDNLRENIEGGLKECRKCIIVLSPYFLSNNGWTKAEFDSIYTREIIEKKNVMLPVWHNVTKEEVYDYSPKLANIFAVSSALGIATMAGKLYKAVMT
jgi:hypothetical protein